MEIIDPPQLPIQPNLEAYELKNNPTTMTNPSIVIDSSVHEPVKCLVCTNSMYPPIHHV